MGKRKIHKQLLLSILLSVIFIFQWAASGNFRLLESNIPIKTYKNWDDIYSRGYVISGDNFYRKDAYALIILPISYSSDRIEISLGDEVSDYLKAKVYYRNEYGNNISEGNFINGIASINIPGSNGPIKIRLEGNLNQSIKLNSICLVKSGYFSLSKIILVFSIAAILLIGILFLVISLILKQNQFISKIFNITILLYMLFFLINIVTSGSYWNSYFFGDVNDSFMDYFNMLALLNNPDPYYQHSFYPPFCFVFLKVLHLLLPKQLQSIESGMTIRNNAVGMFWFFVLIIICTIIIMLVLDNIFEKKLKSYELVVITLSGPFLFCIQRGNLLFLALIFILLYFMYYDSDDVKKRILAYISLAIAANIKIYPALFGLMTLRKKRYKETVFLLILGIGSFVLPFCFFDGINSVKNFLDAFSLGNELVANQGLGLYIDLDHIRKIVNAVFGLNIIQSQVALVIVTIVLLLFAYIAKEDWQAWFLIGTATIWFPTFSLRYAIVLFFPAIILVIKDGIKNSATSVSKFETCLLLLLITPISSNYLSGIDNLAGYAKSNFSLTVLDIITNLIIIYFVIRIIVSIILSYIARENGKLGMKIDYPERKVIALCIMLFTLFGVYSYYNHPYNSNYKFNGKGTLNSPYIISSVDDFLYLQKLANSGETFSGAYFKQEQDLLFSEKTKVVPIGWSKKDACFSGVYDGNGYKIINYYSVSDNDEDMGIFGVLKGEVRNLCVENCNIGGSLVGGIAYEVAKSGKIENCSVSGLLWGYKTGGLAALNYGSINNSIAVVIMDSQKKYGIADSDNVGKVRNSFSNIEEHIMADALIDIDTLSDLNAYANINNMSVTRPYELNQWIIMHNLFCLEK